MTLTFDTHSTSLTYGHGTICSGVSRSTRGDNLNKIGSTCIDNAT